VDKGSELQLKTDYNRTHPPLDTRSVPASFDDHTIVEEAEAGHNDPGGGYNAYNPNTYSGNKATFPGSSSVPSSRGALFPGSPYQQGGSHQQGGKYQQSQPGMQSWTHGQDPYGMGRSASQPGHYGTAGSSGNMYYPGSQHGDYEGDGHRRGSIHSSEYHSSYDPGEAQEALVEEEELGEETETEDHHEPHYDPVPEDEQHEAQEYHEDIYDP
jgi:hypothetical protein